MRSERAFTCIDCGDPCRRMRHPWQPLVCRPCGIARAVTTAVELARCKAEGWPPDGPFTREQFAAPQRERWRRWHARTQR